jgi:hypothetical protein
MESSMTVEEFTVLVRRAGLPLDAAQQAVLHGVHGRLEEMMQRVRTPSPGVTRGRGAEPAHIFVPGGTIPGTGQP